MENVKLADRQLTRVYITLSCRLKKISVVKILVCTTVGRLCFQQAFFEYANNCNAMKRHLRLQRSTVKSSNDDRLWNGECRIFLYNNLRCCTMTFFSSLKLGSHYTVCDFEFVRNLWVLRTVVAKNGKCMRIVHRRVKATGRVLCNSAEITANKKSTSSASIFFLKNAIVR